MSEVFAVLALVVSLGAAFATFRNERAGLGANEYNRVTDLFLRMNELFIAYPQLRPYFYDGVTIDPSDPDDLRVKVIAEQIADIFDWVSHCRAGATSVDASAWAEFIVFVYESSPALRAFHEAHRDWHPVLDEVIRSHGSASATASEAARI